MNRWIVRLGLAGLLVALAAYAWTRMSQEDDEDEFEDEIPIEFDVPMDTPLAAGRSGAAVSANGRDTGTGPGADLQMPSDSTGSDSVTESTETGVDESTTGAAASADTESDSVEDDGAGDHEHDDLTIIRGIGPVFQKRLFEVGVYTFRELADANPAQLEEAGIQGVGVDLESWIEQARELANGHHE